MLQLHVSVDFASVVTSTPRYEGPPLFWQAEERRRQCEALMACLTGEVLYCGGDKLSSENVCYLAFGKWNLSDTKD